MEENSRFTCLRARIGFSSSGHYKKMMGVINRVTNCMIRQPSRWYSGFTSVHRRMYFALVLL